MSVPGAYGLRLSGLERCDWLGVCNAAGWPELSCSRTSDPDAPDVALDVETFELRIRSDIPHTELVHPFLGRVAGPLALLRGADGIHGGAVAGSAGAWAVLGEKGAGKSTLLMALARAGVEVITDDVLVFDGLLALAGPRCIDLRPGAPGSGPGVAVRPQDPRTRMPLPPIAAEHPLVGLVHLEWSDADTTLERLDQRDAIERLLAVRGMMGYPHNPTALLQLGSLPTLLLRRPRSVPGLDASVAQMHRLLLDSEPHLQRETSSARATAGSRVRPSGGSAPTTRGR